MTFNVDPKLRTVLWQFVGEAISPELMTDLERLLAMEQEVRTELGTQLRVEEIDALFLRTVHLFRAGRYPMLDPGANVPYGWW